MKLGSKGRYAVMAMVDLGVHGRERTVALAELSERQGISLAYLEQLFCRLRRRGLVVSVRGPGGGYRLARAARDIAIVDIVDAVGESTRVTRCADAGPVVRGCLRDHGKCLPHDLWAGLGERIRGFLGDVTLEDVCEGRLSPERERPAACGGNAAAT